MDSHKNGRIIYTGSKLLSERIKVTGLTLTAEATDFNVGTPRKWRQWFLE